MKWGGQEGAPHPGSRFSGRGKEPTGLPECLILLYELLLLKVLLPLLLLTGAAACFGRRLAHSPTAHLDNGHREP